jgi:hypothetical protein
MSDQDFANTSDPLGSPKAGLSSDLDNLAAYVSSLTKTPLSPYRDAGGVLTSEGLAGRAVFESRRCGFCHSGSSFTDGKRHDVGTVKPSSGLGIGQPLAGVGFDTPTLKGVWNTAPYLHDGQASTLEDVLNSDEHIIGDALSAAEMGQLVAYLLQIDDREAAPAAVPVPSSSPWDLIVLASIFAAAITGIRMRSNRLKTIPTSWERPN